MERKVVQAALVETELQAEQVVLGKQVLQVILVEQAELVLVVLVV